MGFGKRISIIIYGRIIYSLVCVGRMNMVNCIFIMVVVVGFRRNRIISI